MLVIVVNAELNVEPTLLVVVEAVASGVKLLVQYADQFVLLELLFTVQ